MSGLFGLLDLNMADEPRETPAVVLESKCTPIKVADELPVPSLFLRAESRNDAADELPCQPAGDAEDQPGVAETIDDVGSDFADSSFDPRSESDHADFDVQTLNDASTGDELTRAADAASDTVPDVGLITPRQAGSGDSTNTPRHSDATMADVGSVRTRPDAPSQQSVYFSGASALSKARWKASSETLVDADALLDVIGLDAKASTASPDTIAVIPQGPAVPVESTAISSRSDQALPEVRELTGLDAAFSMVHSWTEKAEQIPSRTGSQVGAAHELSGRQQVDKLVELPLPFAPDADGCLEVVFPAKPAPSEIATADIAPPFGRLHDWSVLGGIGLWQVVLNVRARRRKQSCENLA